MAEFLNIPQATDIIEGGNDFIMFTNDDVTLDNSGTTAVLAGTAEFFAFIPALDSLLYTDVSTVNPSNLNKTALMTGSFRINHVTSTSHSNLQDLQDNVNLNMILRANSAIYAFAKKVNVLTVTALSEADPAGRQDYEVTFESRDTALAEILKGITNQTELAAAHTDGTFTGVPA